MGPRYVDDFSFDSDFGFTGSASRGVSPSKHHGEKGVDRRADAPSMISPTAKGFSKGGHHKKKHHMAEGGKADIDDRYEIQGHAVMGRYPQAKAKGGKFIQKAIKHPGALHHDLGVPEGQKIPAAKLATAAKRSGKVGQRARFAETLKGLHHGKKD